MKLPHVVLAVSLIANLALAYVVSRPGAYPPVIENNSPDSTTPSSPFKPHATRQSSGADQGISADAPDTDAAANSFHWSQLESADYKEYITKLRAFGVPEKVIRDIIIADVSKMYRSRFAALRPPKQSKDEKFWQNRFGWRGPNTGMTREQRAQMLALQKEQKELIQELLGKNVYQEMAKDSGYPDYTDRQFGSLTPEQRDKVTEMQQRFWEVQSELHERSQGSFDEDMQAELKAAQKKMRDELATVLTPEQVKEYELRTSDIANNMRWQLSGFEPDEKEFRTIFDYKKALEELTPRRNPDEDAPKPTADELKAMRDRQKELEKTFADTLGADRVKEYKLLDDWSLKNLLDAGIPKDSVFKVSDMKNESQKAAQKVRSDKSLTPEQRTAALQAIRTETQNTLNDLLGSRRARAYAGNGGWWLNNIAPLEAKP